VYVSMGTGGPNDGVQCVRLAPSPALCGGGWTASPKQAVDVGFTPSGYAQKGHDLHPLPDGFGGHAAVCLYTADGRVLKLSANNPAPACWDPGGNAATLPVMQGFPLCTQTQCVAFTSMNLGSAAGANRVIFARWNNSPLCLEMPTGALCSSWGVGLPTGKRDYGFAPDPLAPNRCVLALGDADEIYRFDGLTGRPGCPVTYQTTGDPMDFFCKKKPAQLAWSRIVIRGRPTSPALTGGTIVVRNTASQAVLLTIPVTASDVYSIASIPYATNHTLTVEYTPTYSTANALVTPYALEVQFTASEAPQICYQARVDRCGEIFNRATYGPLGSPAPSSGFTGPVVLPSPWTASASVGLGDALAESPCDSCPARRDSLDLSIRKTAFYPPWTVGTMGEYQIVTTVEQGTLDPSTAPAPTFTDNLPAGLTFHSFTGAPDWTCVAAGQQVACTYHGPLVPAGHPLPPVTISVNVVGPQAGGTVVNCAVLGPDANLANNRSCVEATIRPCLGEYDLGIRKEAVGGPWKAGTNQSFRIQVTVTQGTFVPGAAPGPTFVDVLPPGVTFVTATGTGWNCSTVGSQVSCTYQGTLPVVATTVLPPVTIVVHLSTHAAPITNCALLRDDRDLANNRACVNKDIVQ
ncbi:MAG TPA: hypothetical protein VFJ82_00305, partial [Longimicrobium sp.]|nr:hypothetical protein [Longimicrobium sp.]